MKTGKHMALALALTAAACAQAPKPAAIATAPVSDATSAPAALAAPVAEAPMDPAIIATAQRNLRALGYAAGKAGDTGDAAFQRAVLAFEKDQGLPEDGHLTQMVADRLKSVRAALVKSAALDGNRNATFVYGDGAVRRQPLALFVTPPAGLVSDAPANFLQPLRPGAQASYRLGKRASDGSFNPVMTISCQVARSSQTSLPLNASDTIAVDCHGDGAAGAPQWRSFYSPALGAVTRQQTATGIHDLVAIRPLTSDWPSAARTGLDWALTSALDAPVSSAPVQWSSTAVAPHIEIRATARIAGQEAGLSGKYAKASCRRFEMVQSGNPVSHYPGIACQNETGAWLLPGSQAPLATSAGAMARSSPVALRSAQSH